MEDLPYSNEFVTRMIGVAPISFWSRNGALLNNYWTLRYDAISNYNMALRGQEEKGPLDPSKFVIQMLHHVRDFDSSLKVTFRC